MVPILVSYFLCHVIFQFFPLWTRYNSLPLGLARWRIVTNGMVSPSNTSRDSKGLEWINKARTVLPSAISATSTGVANLLAQMEDGRNGDQSNPHLSSAWLIWSPHLHQLARDAWLSSVKSGRSLRWSIA